MNKDVTWLELLVEGEAAAMRSDNTGQQRRQTCSEAVQGRPHLASGAERGFVSLPVGLEHCQS